MERATTLQKERKQVEGKYGIENVNKEKENEHQRETNCSKARDGRKVTH